MDSFSPSRSCGTTTLALTLLLTAALTGGYLLVATPAHAACGALTNCGGDPTLTSALDVQHEYDDGTTIWPVEPDDSDVWDITPTWSSAFGGLWCVCDDWTASATATVTWTGSSWSASCTGCDAVNGPIYGVSVCTFLDNPCTYKSWHYRLLVNLEGTRTRQCTVGTDYFLNDVLYELASADDGDYLDNCIESGVVVPITPASVSVHDTGAFECAFTCAATGSLVTIRYAP